MNQLLFERASGTLGPNVFAKLEATRLLSSFRPAPHIRFNGGETGSAIDNGESSSRGSSAVIPGQEQHVWAHQAGVNALALERFDGRL
jgi:DNA excision repair protein ERCC-8